MRIDRTKVSIALSLMAVLLSVIAIASTLVIPSIPGGVVAFLARSDVQYAAPNIAVLKYYYNFDKNGLVESATVMLKDTRASGDALTYVVVITVEVDGSKRAFQNAVSLNPGEGSEVTIEFDNVELDSIKRVTILVQRI